MTIENIKKAVLILVPRYHITRAVLFGSRAAGTNGENSDVDLIVEFAAPVSLMTLAMLRDQLEEMLNLGVDIIHGPIRESDFLDIKDKVELYAA